METLSEIVPDSNNHQHVQEVTIVNRLGLHARAAARLVQLAQRFSAEVELEKDGEAADAKSVLSLLTLACPLGTRVILRTKGPDAAPALEALTELIENKFGEE
jgi:phosphocarrier protein